MNSSRLSYIAYIIYLKIIAYLTNVTFKMRFKFINKVKYKDFNLPTVKYSITKIWANFCKYVPQKKVIYIYI